MSKKVEERLQELLDAKDAEIERLNEALEEAEFKATANFRWTVHKHLDSDESGLPLPRLEMRFKKMSEPDEMYDLEIVTYLVYRHLRDEVMCVPINRTRTTCSGPARYHNGRFDLPFRDGAHIMHDAAHLNLPAFATDEEGHVENLADRIDEYAHQIQAGREHRRAP